jgi:hypothetical protein
MDMSSAIASRVGAKAVNSGGQIQFRAVTSREARVARSRIDCRGFCFWNSTDAKETASKIRVCFKCNLRQRATATRIHHLEHPSQLDTELTQGQEAYVRRKNLKDHLLDLHGRQQHHKWTAVNNPLWSPK